jgi:hypothetical protein
VRFAATSIGVLPGVSKQQVLRLGSRDETARASLRMTVLFG